MEFTAVSGLKQKGRCGQEGGRGKSVWAKKLPSLVQTVRRVCTYGGSNHRKPSSVKCEPKESYLVSVISQLFGMILPDLHLGVLGPREFKDEPFKKKRMISSAKAVERSKNVRANAIPL